MVGPLDTPSELDGAALEGLVAQHLRAWCDSSRGRHQLHYWQTRAQVEVDFVIYGESGLYAVEVKNRRQIRPEDLNGLKAFGEDYPQSQRYPPLRFSLDIETMRAAYVEFIRKQQSFLPTARKKDRNDDEK